MVVGISKVVLPYRAASEKRSEEQWGGGCQEGGMALSQ